MRTPKSAFFWHFGVQPHKKYINYLNSLDLKHVQAPSIRFVHPHQADRPQAREPGRLQPAHPKPGQVPVPAVPGLHRPQGHPDDLQAHDGGAGQTAAVGPGRGPQPVAGLPDPGRDRPDRARGGAGLQRAHVPVVGLHPERLDRVQAQPVRRAAGVRGHRPQHLLPARKRPVGGRRRSDRRAAGTNAPDPAAALLRHPGRGQGVPARGDPGPPAQLDAGQPAAVPRVRHRQPRAGAGQLPLAQSGDPGELRWHRCRQAGQNGDRRRIHMHGQAPCGRQRQPWGLPRRHPVQQQPLRHRGSALHRARGRRHRKEPRRHHQV